MTPVEFLNDVVRENIALASREPDNLRLVCNAVLTLDALVGVIWAEGHSGKKKDGELRDEIAKRSECFQVARDLAFSIKHGRLDDRKVRLVQDHRAVSKSTMYLANMHALSDHEALSEYATVIEIEGRKYYAFKILKFALQAVEAVLNGQKPAEDRTEDTRF